MLISFSLWFLNLLPLWVVVVFRDVRSILANSNNLGAEWCGVVGCVLGLVCAMCVLFSVWCAKEHDKDVVFIEASCISVGRRRLDFGE